MDSPTNTPPTSAPLPPGEGGTPNVIDAATVVLPAESAPLQAPESTALSTDDQWSTMLHSHGLGAFVGDARVLQGLRAYESDANVYVDAYDRMIESLPPGTKFTDALPLSGAALETAITDAAARYFPFASSMQLAQARPLLARAAQETHRLRSALVAGERLKPTLAAQHETARERSAQAKVSPVVKQMTEAEYASAYGEAWSRWYQASQEGNWLDRQRALEALSRLGKGRYGG